MTSIHCTRLAW